MAALDFMISIPSRKTVGCDDRLRLRRRGSTGVLTARFGSRLAEAHRHLLAVDEHRRRDDDRRPAVEERALQVDLLAGAQRESELLAEIVRRDQHVDAAALAL